MNKLIVNTALTCRICGSAIAPVTNLGEIHINDFPENPFDSKGFAPLKLDRCKNCSLVQLRHTVDPKVLYGDFYWYQSGLNPKLKQNLLDIAYWANERTMPGDIVLDIGANDGTLLSGVNKDRYRIGCEPASNLQDMLKEHCEETIPYMWHEKYMKGRKAKFISAIGMFYDMDDPNEFIWAVKQSLSDDGIFVAQLMTLVPMLRNNDLGNICHEHLEYYSYQSLVELYERNGLEIYHVEENDIQGGSYQLWARHLKTGSIEYKEVMPDLGDFFEKIQKIGDDLRATLEYYNTIKAKCYVYGASTKGNTLLQIWMLGAYFKGAAEIHPDKIGRYTVGTYIPIVHEDEARKNADVFFVPNYGFKDLFIEKEREWIERGGKMLFAMPEIELVTNENINSSRT